MIGRTVSGFEENPLRWVQLGGWAVADQALFATSNFTLTILLARWLGPAEFGAFTIAQSAFLLFGVFHAALLAEPMLVFGSSRFAENFSSYLRHLVRGHWLFTAGAAGLLSIAAAACWLRGSRSAACGLFGASLSTPAMLLVWLGRRAAFACFRPAYAAAAGAGYLLLMVVGMTLLHTGNLLSPLHAFLVLGVCGLCVGTLLVRALGYSAGGEGTLRARQLIVEHWRYGRWALATSAITWAGGNLYFFLLPIAGGLASAGAFRALSNLVLPMFQGIAALSVLLLPTLSRTRDVARFRAVLVVALLVFVGSATVFWVLVGSFAKPAMSLLYGGNYAEHAHLLWLLGGLPVIAGLVAVLSNALRARERPDLVFRAYLASAGITLTFGVWAAVRWQLTGAVLGQVLANSATAALLVVLFRRSRAAAPATAGGPLREPAPSSALLRLPAGHPA